MYSSAHARSHIGVDLMNPTSCRALPVERPEANRFIQDTYNTSVYWNSNDIAISLHTCIYIARCFVSQLSVAC